MPQFVGTIVVVGGCLPLDLSGLGGGRVVSLERVIFWTVWETFYFWNVRCSGTLSIKNAEEFGIRDV